MLLKDKIENLPSSSGVYIMKDSAENIIYIGKAVVLKNRVRQYFTNTQKIPKVAAMVENVADFEYIITLSEKDALSLESNLIKKYKPKYNILLKDDKSSPYIKINLNDKFPTLEVTRKVKKDGAKYFGPYFNGIHASDIIEIIRAAYKMRTCPKGYNSNKRECLNYHIGLCLAPCCGRVSGDEYREVVNKVVAFLSGREDGAERLIAQKMEDAVAREDFERAITHRNSLEMLKKLKSRTLSELDSKIDIDSFSYVTDLYHSAVSVCIVRSGKLMGVKNFSIADAALNEEEVLTNFITQYYALNPALPESICLENEFDVAVLREYLNSLSKYKTDIIFPKIGAKKKLVQMAKENALDFLEKSVEKVEHEKDMTERAANDLKEILKVKSTRRIECYDISHISGVDKVASGIVFINGAPSYSDYRRYKIKTVEGSNDFACMAEVISRRFRRAKEKDEKFTDLPDLIVIDGGKGQLSSAYEAMKNAGFDIEMVSLAEKNEEIFTLDSPYPIVLPKTCYPLKLMQRIRDEAHRFAITYHRKVRSKRYVANVPKVKKKGET